LGVSSGWAHQGEVLAAVNLLVDHLVRVRVRVRARVRANPNPNPNPNHLLVDHLLDLRPVVLLEGVVAQRHDDGHLVRVRVRVRVKS